MGKRPISQSQHQAPLKTPMEARPHCRSLPMQLWHRGPVMMPRDFPLKKSSPAMQLQQSARERIPAGLLPMGNSLKASLSSGRWR